MLLDAMMRVGQCLERDAKPLLSLIHPVVHLPLLLPVAPESIILLPDTRLLKYSIFSPMLSSEISTDKFVAVLLDMVGQAWLYLI